MFIDGFLSICSAAGSGAVTEMGLPRQPISFGEPSGQHPLTKAYGVSRNTRPVVFPAAGVTTLVAGFGIFDQPLLGNLLLVLPLYAPRPLIGGGRSFWADVGDLYLAIDALAANPIGDTLSGIVNPGAQIGEFFDTLAIIGPQSVSSPSGYVPAAIQSMPATAGSSSELIIERGVLRYWAALPTN